MNRNKIIEEAQELLRKGWTKDYLACGDKGYPIDYRDKDACAFCAVGAMARIIDDNKEGRGLPYMDVGALIRPVSVEALTNLNDAADNVDEVIAYLETLKEPA